MEDMQLTLDEQIAFLARPAPEWAVQKDSKVAHGKPWTAHEYVVHLMDVLFGADHWSHRQGTISPINLPNNDQLIYVPGYLTVTFADGSTVVRSDIGVGLVQGPTGAVDLSSVKADSFETAFKSATTDGIKGCAADLGRCFRPMQSGMVAGAIGKNRFDEVFREAFPDGVRTKAAQVAYLKRLVPNWAVQRDANVAQGKPYVPHEFVAQMLDVVFGPHRWSFVIKSVTPTDLPNGEMLVYVAGQLTARFADGSTARPSSPRSELAEVGSAATRSDVGIAPVRLKKNAEDLRATPTENFETAFKAAATDALKGCAGDLGRCFRPMLSEAVQNAIARGFFENELKMLRPLADPAAALTNGKKQLGRDDGDLVAASDAAKTNGPTRLYGDGTPIADHPTAKRAFDAFVLEHNGVAPTSPNALRVWARLYTDFAPVADNATAKAAFDAYVQAHGGIAPDSADALKAWHKKPGGNGKLSASRAAMAASAAA